MSEQTVKETRRRKERKIKKKKCKKFFESRSSKTGIIIHDQMNLYLKVRLLIKERISLGYNQMDKEVSIEEKRVTNKNS